MRPVLPGHGPPSLAGAAERIVCLVPSITDSISALGLGDRLVGVTDFCPVPANARASLARVGGSKSPRLDVILELQPDLVIANKEENSPQMVQGMRKAGLSVWLIFPRSVADALQVLRQLLHLCHAEGGVPRLRALERAFEGTAQAASQRKPVRYFCPIWQDEDARAGVWWMTFNADTYPHDLLRHLGGMNAFAKRERRYPLLADLGMAEPEDPGERDTRYPRLGPAEVAAAAAELILLPDEPYAFGDEDMRRMCSLLSDTPAVREERIFALDGRLLFWYGTYLEEALSALPAILGTDSSQAP
jgi:ABC-type Fe3+-hydroxamate transport system substrate-binding protein